jgi:hypothetical protein
MGNQDCVNNPSSPSAGMRMIDRTAVGRGSFATVCDSELAFLVAEDASAARRLRSPFTGYRFDARVAVLGIATTRSVLLLVII